MTLDEFDATYRAFCRRRPFRTFSIEFTSGELLAISHPEAVRRERSLYAVKTPTNEDIVFTAASVCRVLDEPADS